MIRVATGADAESIARVWIRSWQQAYGQVFPREVLDSLSMEERTRQTSSTLEREGMRVLVSEVDGEIGGFACVGPSQAFDGCGELYAIYLEGVHWGSGLGQALLERAEAELRSQLFPAAVLQVLAENPRARGFYERNGWVAGETLRESIRGHDVELVRYRKDLTGRDAEGDPAGS